MADPNPCRTPSCRTARPRIRPTVTIDPHSGGATEVRCPRCRHWLIGDTEEKAVAEWNHYHPSPRIWPYIAAALVLTALLWGAMSCLTL